MYKCSDCATTIDPETDRYIVIDVRFVRPEEASESTARRVLCYGCSVEFHDRDPHTPDRIIDAMRRQLGPDGESDRPPE